MKIQLDPEHTRDRNDDNTLAKAPVYLEPSDELVPFTVELLEEALQEYRMQTDGKNPFASTTAYLSIEENPNGDEGHVLVLRDDDTDGDAVVVASRVPPMNEVSQ